MNRAISALTSRLSGGENGNTSGTYSHGFVATLAKGYETARNALEYRAENLVRRAAIERILKRLILINKNPDNIARHLLDELKWARYLGQRETGSQTKQKLSAILGKYISYRGKIPSEWIIKIASAEIEELFNLNKDYNQFTFFAFQVVKQKVKIEHENLDLLIYFAVDKIYAGSDPEQIAYHIISLGDTQIDTAKMEEGWRLFNIAQKDPLTPRVNKFVRRQMPPVVLLRDMYFANPKEFKEILETKDRFKKSASEVLDTQLELMSGKISTAGVRSVVYVFLTKMVLAFGLEAPLETLIYGQISMLPLLINLGFPPLIMWSVTSQIRIPSRTERELLIDRTVYVVENFDSLKDEEDTLTSSDAGVNANSSYLMFSVIYGIIFLGIFLAIYFILGLIGFKFMSKVIFVFFLTIIAFFAYRISQISSVYHWRGNTGSNTSIFDMFLLPILTIGSSLSLGLSKLNFLGLIFDFILEAPFKMILRFLDDWVQFLSQKREQQVLD